MKVIIIGGDNISMITCHLCDKGYFVIKHISGRKKAIKLLKIHYFLYNNISTFSFILC